VEIETFPALKLPGIRHGFSTRSPSSLDLLDAELMTTFAAAGFPMERAVHAEQPHGNRVAIVEHEMQERVKDVDALATSLPQLPLVVRVADCGPVFFYDPVRRAIAVAHSGRRGTEGNIETFWQQAGGDRGAARAVHSAAALRGRFRGGDRAASAGRGRGEFLRRGNLHGARFIAVLFLSGGEGEDGTDVGSAHAGIGARPKRFA
jgi:hypothetical protein